LNPGAPAQAGDDVLASERQLGCADAPQQACAARVIDVGSEQERRHRGSAGDLPFDDWDGVGLGQPPHRVGAAQLGVV